MAKKIEYAFKKGKDMKKTKQIDTYYCDFCGKECEHTDFVIPVKESIYVEKSEIKLAKFGEMVVPKTADICPECQTKMAYVMPSIIKCMEFDLNNPGATVIVFGHE